MFIGDIAGISGWPSFLPHSAAKGALRPLVRGLARSLAPRIRVSIVHPGTVLLPEGDDGDELSRACRCSASASRPTSPARCATC